MRAWKGLRWLSVMTPVTSCPVHGSHRLPGPGEATVVPYRHLERVWQPRPAQKQGGGSTQGTSLGGCSVASISRLTKPECVGGAWDCPLLGSWGHLRLVPSGAGGTQGLPSRGAGSPLIPRASSQAIPGSVAECDYSPGLIPGTFKRRKTALLQV